MKKKILFIVLAVIIVWISLLVVDNLRVAKYEQNPLFCIETDNGSNHYAGLGYSFDIYSHPITGEFQYGLNIFGISVKSTFTN